MDFDLLVSAVSAVAWGLGMWALARHPDREHEAEKQHQDAAGAEREAALDRLVERYG